MELLPTKRLQIVDANVLLTTLYDLRDYVETILDSSGEDDGEAQLIRDVDYAIVMVEEAPVE